MNVTPVVEWECPACGQTDVTNDPRPHTRMHVCPRMRFLSAPMVRAGTRAKLVLREREDYVGRERVQLDPEQGRPVMSIETVRDDGSNDVMVFAPLANAQGA